MSKHEFSKYEIATYLRDFNRTMNYASFNQDISFFEVFKNVMRNDGRLQYAHIDYYLEMITIYEILLVSKFLSILYDNYFDFLLESSIDNINIPNSIFVDSSDANRFSKKQIIKYIRNALNHNDNPNHDLFKFIRINENGKDEIKIEISLINTKPIPFHVVLSIDELISIYFEIKKSNSIRIASNLSTKPILLNSLNVSDTINHIYLRKYFARKKLSDEQKKAIISYINSGNKIKNNSEFLLENGLEYKDYNYSIAQKIKIEEDLKYWESLGVYGNDVIHHLLYKVLPFSWSKDRALTMNLILTDYYMRLGKSCIFDIINDARKLYFNKNLIDESPLGLYGQSFGIDYNILFDSIDFANIISITNAIYYGYLFDSLVTDKEVNITDSKIIEREKIRDSFVHMRWFMGARECFKLFDWENGIDNEYNTNSPNFWKCNVGFIDMGNCAELYFKNSIKANTQSSGYMDLPIHFRKRESKLAAISFIKNGVFYFIDLTGNYQEFELLVCDNTQIQRSANDDEKRTFISELENLSPEEKVEFSDLIELIKNNLMYQCKHNNM